MPYYLALVLLIGIGWWGIPQSVENAPQVPVHFAMGGEYKAAIRHQGITSWQGMDSLLFHQLELLSDSLGNPLLFYSNIHTPVCIDGSCKPMYIEIYWNLVGDYVGYGVFQEELLTKFDHELFEANDYQRLHTLLLDKNSILKRKQLSDLFDSNPKPTEKITYQGKEVDAVSGATKKEIKESVVEGALYSCFTIWHLVHGEVRNEMRRYIDSAYSPELAAYFVNSQYGAYQLYAIQQMDSLTMAQSLPRLVEICIVAKPLTRTYLLKKLPKSLWSQSVISEELYPAFSRLDVNSQTLLLRKLEYADPTVLETLSTQGAKMTKNQLKMYLAFLRLQPKPLLPTIKTNLQSLVESQQHPYGYLVADFLNEK